MAGRLFIEFCGEEYLVEPDGELTFGRSGALVVDDNPYLHRVLGRFVMRRGVWWIDHLSDRTPVTVRDLHSPANASVAPGTSHALTHGEFRVGFTAGPTRYELEGALEDGEWAIDLLGPDGLEGTRTLDWGRVELNPDQRSLLVALCEGRLRSPSAWDHPVPSRRDGAQRLGWSEPKFARKLDHLCEKLTRAGVAGLLGDTAAGAVDRRTRLVEHAIEARLVTAEDLALLDDLRVA